MSIFLGVKKLLKRERSWPFIVSVLFNVLLLLPFIMQSVSLIRAEYKCDDFRENIKSKNRTGLTLIALTENELRDRPKQFIVDLLASINKQHPEFLEYYGHGRVYGSDKEKICIRYGGTYFIFRDEKFVSFDTDLNKKACRTEDESFSYTYMRYFAK